MDLSVGPIRLRIEAASDELAQVLRDVTGSWPRRDLPPDILPLPPTDLRLESRSGRLPPDRPRVREGDPAHGAWRLGQDPLWLAEGQGLRQVRLTLHGHSPEVAAYGLRQFLRHFTADALLASGGIVLHGAAVARPGGAAVFLAAEGGGKTTLARRHGGACVLADDTVLVVAGRPGPWVVPSPFTGREATTAPGGPAPLRWLADLRKGGQDAYVEPLDRAGGAQVVLAHAKADVGSLEVRRRLLDAALGLATRPGVVRLGLPWDADPWSLLDGPGGAGGAP